MKTLATRILVLVVLALLAGCGHKAPPAASAADTRAFDTAPPEVKQVWDQALAADRSNDYLVAQTLFYRLSNQGLSPEQKEAVNRQMAANNKRLSDAVEKGDPAALKALQELRRNPPNR